MKFEVDWGGWQRLPADLAFGAASWKTKGSLSETCVRPGESHLAKGQTFSLEGPEKNSWSNSSQSGWASIFLSSLREKVRQRSLGFSLHSFTMYPVPTLQTAVGWALKNCLPEASCYSQRVQSIRYQCQAMTNAKRWIQEERTHIYFFLHVSLCVACVQVSCMFTCVWTQWTWMQTLVAVKDWSVDCQRFILGTFLGCSLLYSLRQSFPVELINLASLASQACCSVPAFIQLEFPAASSPEWLYISTRNLNSGIHARWQDLFHLSHLRILEITSNKGRDTPWRLYCIREGLQCPTLQAFLLPGKEE